MANENIWAVEYSSQLKWLRVDKVEKMLEWEYCAHSAGHNLGFIKLGSGYKSEEMAVAVAREFILTHRLDLSGTMYKYF